ncbi:Crp/Fnr family transcriptional regulator [Caldalkalibacillus mannanilyticus]|uniref:Crp/Fnr family transcriptional regulator n=1 Tax=Caldalkalibacillus mannanilyticus TaxID=1418 RepID=UPI00046A9C33|nr:Crp/Fnr family transcriptional regulator [Caldalkalibacillus mannanilyticus]
MKDTQTTMQCPYLVKNTSSFSQDNFNKLETIMYELKSPANMHLFREGDVTDKLYYVKQGQIKITKPTEDGRNLVLYLFKEGDMFGEISSFGELRYSFNAETMTDCVLGVIQQRDLEILLWQHGDLAVEFMKWMGLMHRITQSKFRDLMLYGKTGALCSTLIRLTNTCGKDIGTGIKIDRRITNNELGDMIGATRESVNRMLRDLAKQDIITNELGYITVHDLEYLREICHCENCPRDICRV